MQVNTTAFQSVKTNSHCCTTQHTEISLLYSGYSGRLLLWTSTVQTINHRKFIMYFADKKSFVLYPVINPQRACAARVIVLGLCVCVCVCVCLCVCLCVRVCLLLNISLFHVFIRATNDTNLLSGG